LCCAVQLKNNKEMILLFFQFFFTFIPSWEGLKDASVAAETLQQL